MDTTDIDSFMELIEEDNPVNLRKFPRKEVNIKIKFMRENSNGKVEDTRYPESEDKIVNISRNGVGIQTMRKFFINDLVHIESLSDNVNFELKLRNKRLIAKEGDYFIYGCKIISKSSTKQLNL